MPKSWYLYMLECAGGRLYTGITVDVGARYRAHAEGRGAKFTRSFPPNRILFVQGWPTRSQASKAEHAIKKLSPEAKRQLAESSCPTLKTTPIGTTASTGSKRTSLTRSRRSRI